jgi:hypothetical protein
MYLHAKFHVVSFSGSLDIAVEKKAKQNVRIATMLCFAFYKNFVNKNYIYFQNLLPYIT